MAKRKKTLQEIFDMFPTRVNLYDGSRPMHPKGPKANRGFYFGCDCYDHPCFVIQWSEKGRGFGEYTFYEKKGKIYCDNECDSKEAVMRIMCQLVQNAIFTQVSKTEDKCSVLKVTSSSKRKSTTTKQPKSRKDS